MIIKIEPFDTLFFRSGRPMVIGEDTWAESIFPPSPSTFYGSLRSFLISNGGSLEEFRKGTHKYTQYVGRIENRKIKYGSLRIRGLYLYKDDQVYIPSPFDLVKLKGDKGNKLIQLNMKTKPVLFISNYPLEYHLSWGRNEQVKEASGWLDSITFKDYLLNRKNEFNIIPNDSLFDYEKKIGIARDRNTFTSKEGHLYRIPLIRLDGKRKVYFLVEINGMDSNVFPSSGIFQLGGEGKGVKFEVLKEDPLMEIKNLKIKFENKFFKIYFATPAIFKNGWFPSWINKETFEGEFNGIRLKLIACAIGRPQSIGGWNVARNKPKPMRKLIPAGSIYYFKILGDSGSEEIKENLHFKNISDDFDDIYYSKEGFGLSILGEVKI